MCDLGVDFVESLILALPEIPTGEGTLEALKAFWEVKIHCYDYDVVLPYKVAKAGPYATVLHTRYPYYSVRNRLDRFCCLRTWIRHQFAGWRQIWAEIITTDGGKLQKKSHIMNPLFDSLAHNTGRYFTRYSRFSSPLGGARKNTSNSYRPVLRAKLSNKVYVSWIIYY